MVVSRGGGEEGEESAVGEEVEAVATRGGEEGVDTLAAAAAAAAAVGTLVATDVRRDQASTSATWSRMHPARETLRAAQNKENPRV